MHCEILLLLVALCQTIYCNDASTAENVAANNGIPPNVDESTKISFESPTMSDEEQFSAHLPTGFGCDACTAIAYQVFLSYFAFSFTLLFCTRKIALGYSTDIFLE